MQPAFPYSIHNLGDDALLIDFGNRIDLTLNQYVVQLQEAIRKAHIPSVTETVAAYASIAVYYNVAEAFRRKGNFATAKAYVQHAVEVILLSFKPYLQQQEENVIRIPVCYEPPYAPDLAYLAKAKCLSPQEVIEQHTKDSYYIYMIGFLPGFAYMGEVDDRIALGRKQQPVAVTAGSVGIAGKQTGIYPLASPGGWNIIGRTPMHLFDTNREIPCWYKAGDCIQFYSISANEFDHYKSRDI